MLIDVRKIHEDVFQYLIQQFYNKKSLPFSLRKSNRAGKLEQGYWFYGGKNYVAISFWSGMDWKNRTPNIYFVIVNDGRTFLEIAVSDSDKKREFIERFFLNTPLDLSPSGRRYLKEYSEFGRNYLESLNNFLQHDKRFIDDLIGKYQSFFEDSSDRISFIEISDFESTLNKVETYRNLSIAKDEVVFKQALLGFQIKDYGPIVDTGYIKIREGVQWIFLVGENGTGKTSFLRAIASALCHTKLELGSNTFIKLNLTDSTGQNFRYERIGNDDVRKRTPLVSGFCCYGAARLKTSNEYRNKFSFEKSLNKNGLTSSLFNIDTILIDIQDQLNYWERNERLNKITTIRKEYIRELLVDLLPRVFNIQYSKQGNWENTLYVEKDENDKELLPVTFDKLASGLKSLIAMIGDMMMRLFNQQPTVADPSELSGIVLIDEIDIHLHPNLQKYLVEQLTTTFPKVQFVASTHSPIPLLGAPLNSHFFKVERNSESGVELTDLSEIGVYRLLPNAILTSDLFAMNRLFSRETIDEIRTEDTLKEISFNDAVKSELKQIAERLKGQ